MTNVTEGQGLGVQCVILLTSTGRLMDMPSSDWLTENGY